MPGDPRGDGKDRQNQPGGQRGRPVRGAGLRRRPSCGAVGKRRACRADCRNRGNRRGHLRRTRELLRAYPVSGAFVGLDGRDPSQRFAHGLSDAEDPRRDEQAHRRRRLLQRRAVFPDQRPPTGARSVLDGSCLSVGSNACTFGCHEVSPVHRWDGRGGPECPEGRAPVRRPWFIGHARIGRRSRFGGSAPYPRRVGRRSVRDPRRPGRDRGSPFLHPSPSESLDFASRCLSKPEANRTTVGGARQSAVATAATGGADQRAQRAMARHSETVSTSFFIEHPFEMTRTSSSSRRRCSLSSHNRADHRMTGTP